MQCELLAISIQGTETKKLLNVIIISFEFAWNFFYPGSNLGLNDDNFWNLRNPHLRVECSKVRKPKLELSIEIWKV